MLAKRRQHYLAHRNGKIAAYKAANRDKILAQNREYCRTEKAKAGVRAYHLRRRLSLTSTNLTAEWLLALKQAAQVCPICAVVMDVDGRLPHGKTFDHILPVSAGGRHLKANLRVICRRCNLNRPKDGSDLVGSPEELKATYNQGEPLAPRTHSKFTHGTVTSYQWCHCPLCRAAKAEAGRKYYRANKAKIALQRKIRYHAQRAKQISRMV